MTVWKLWLDDKINDPDAIDRHVPDGFIGAASSREALDLVYKLGMPSHMDLDHDLGESDDALVFLKSIAGACLFAAPTWTVHSSNPVGRDRINAFMKSWTKSAEDTAEKMRAYMEAPDRARSPYRTGDPQAEIERLTAEVTYLRRQLSEMSASIVTKRSAWEHMVVHHSQFNELETTALLDKAGRDGFELVSSTDQNAFFKRRLP